MDEAINRVGVLEPGSMTGEDVLGVRIIDSLEQWRGYRLQWEELFAASPTAAAPLRYSWLWHWWDLYGGGQGLRLATVWRGGRLIGALPLYRHGGAALGERRMGMLSSGEEEFEETCADYLDLLHLPGEQRTCLDWLADVLLRPARPGWDRMELDNLSEVSPLLGWASSRPGGWKYSVESAGACPIADLNGGMDAYLARLSHKTRQHVRQLLRAVDKAGATLEIAADMDQGRQFFADLVRLHQQRWMSVGKPGCFAAPRFAEFHRRMVDDGVAKGEVMLARLSLRNEPLAVLYGFVVNDKLDFYQSGVTIADGGPIASPGSAAIVALLSRLPDRGIRYFDFLRGSSSYKERLATQSRSLVKLVIVRANCRSAVSGLGSLVCRGAGKAWRLLQLSS